MVTVEYREMQRNGRNAEDAVWVVRTGIIGLIVSGGVSAVLEPHTITFPKLLTRCITSSQHYLIWISSYSCFLRLRLIDKRVGSSRQHNFFWTEVSSRFKRMSTTQ